MKTALFLLMLIVGSSTAAEPVIVLTPKEEKEEYDDDYGEQLLEKFSELLKKDSPLKEQFDELESEPKERAGGRYLGSSQSIFILHRSVDVDFAQARKLSKLSPNRRYPLRI